jgi:hypothetical protein
MGVAGIQLNGTCTVTLTKRDQDSKQVAQESICVKMEGAAQWCHISALLFNNMSVGPLESAKGLLDDFGKLPRKLEIRDMSCTIYNRLFMCNAGGNIYLC